MKTAIIGSGIGGLITALYLSKDGVDVTIFEKSNELGGRLAFVNEGNYKIDKGPTIVLLPDMLKEILNEVGIDASKLDLVRCDPLYKLQYPNGLTYSKWVDEEQQIEEVTDKFPGEEKNFARYLKDMEHRFHEGKVKFLDRSFVQKRDFWNTQTIKSLWKLKAYQTVKEQAKQYFQHPILQEAYSFQTLYIGGSPFQSPALYSLVPFSEHYHGIWYVKGGYASLVSILEQELQKRNVKIVKDSVVEEIMVEDKHCTGLFVNGESFSFDQFIFNGDFPSLKEILPSIKMKKQFVPSSGTLLIYLGLDKIYESEAIHHFFMSNDLDRHMKDVFVNKQLPRNPAIYTFHPSIVDESLAPKGHGVLYTLVPVPASLDIDWDDIDEYVDRILVELEERGFPGLRDHIVWKKVRTPKDAHLDGLYQGGSFGIAPTLQQSGVFRPQLQPSKYENLYAVGASIHPGGGVPIVMQGAKLLAEHLKSKGVQK